MNMDKSEVVPMSGCCPLLNQWELRWFPKCIRYLGIHITSDYKDMVQENVKPLLHLMKIDFGPKSIFRYGAWGMV